MTLNRDVTYKLDYRQCRVELIYQMSRSKVVSFTTQLSCEQTHTHTNTHNNPTAAPGPRKVVDMTVRTANRIFGSVRHFTSRKLRPAPLSPDIYPLQEGLV